MWIILWCVKARRNIHRGGIKNKNTTHTYFLFCIMKLENPKLLDRHPASLLPIENLSKPTRTTNLQMADR
jgi:hypothetical protein